MQRVKKLSVILLLLGASLASAANWFSLYLAGEKVGYSYSNSMVVREGEYAGGIWFESYSTMQLVRDGQSMLTSSRRRELYNAEGTLVRATDNRLSGGETVIIEATLEDGVLGVRQIQGTIIGRRYLEGGLVGTLGTHFITGSVGPGERIDYRCYDSAYTEVIEASLVRGELEELTLDGETFLGYHNVSSFAGVPRDIYLRADGSLIVVKVPGGMEVRPAASEEEAKADVGWVDPTAAAAIFPKGSLESAREVTSMSVVVEAAAAPPEGPFQRVTSLGPGRWRVDFTNLADPSPTPETPREDYVATLNRRAESLRDPHSEYNTLAALAEWVAGYLDKTPVGLELTAQEIYARRYGDCSEHAALLADLARRASLPARTVVGLVYGVGHAFYYHAWNEIYADGRWRLVDAFLDQLPADAARISLAYDPTPVERTSFYGDVRSIEILEAR